MSELIVIIIIFLLIGLIVLVVGAPLRAARRETAGQLVVEHDDAESAREAKYREIRDAELDFRTGKLSREDYEAIDTQLRAEALAILDRLEDSGISASEE